MMGLEQVIQDHQWHGGYFCKCGHELNSPEGFTRHVLTEAENALLARITSPEMVDVIENFVPLGFVKDRDPYENVSHAARAILRAVVRELRG